MFLALKEIQHMSEITDLKIFKTSYDYKQDLEKLQKFILFYVENDGSKYLSQLKNLKSSIQIFIEDVSLYDDSGLAQRIEENAMTYIHLIHKVVDNILFNENEVLLDDEDENVYFYHRIARLKEKQPKKKPMDVFPSLLLRDYMISIIPRKNSKIYSVREIKSKEIGRLIRVRGIVTRVGQVKPNIKVATYVCEGCGSETYQQVSGEVFEILEECPSEKCRIRKVKGTLSLQTRGSKFVKHQSVRIQELSSDVPHGCIPRTLIVECYGDVTDRCKPGDCVLIGGVFVPKPYVGYRGIRAGLLTDTYLYACAIQPQGTSIETITSAIRDIGVDSMVNSIAPEIFGMKDVKKILLLMLVGAPPQLRGDGMRIRGDINVLLLGDPGIAKSQLLKTVVKISRRGVYTTGKGSSGVGLTASVSKDPITGEMVLEGGALVLSDNGVCCIDELDKMGEIDRASIHEVMEQQQVSVSKAGINTTLNARCAVLGAANPVRGRYDLKRSVENNVGLPCALLSRFDVLVVLRDEADLDADLSLASHITSLYIEDAKEEVSYEELRHMIDKARGFNPIIPKNLTERLTNAYIEARKENSSLTPRYLLSLIRLSLAHCRLRMCEAVNEEDIDESIRLLEICRVSVKREGSDKVPAKHAIYNLIIKIARNTGRNTKEISLEEIWRKTENKYSQGVVRECIEDFESCGVWTVRDDTLVIFD
jgi:DNA replication licensing factor MCM7